jgi:hypothetical protein
MLFAFEHFRPKHGRLHFGALLFRSVLVDHAQGAGIHVDFNSRAGACVGGTALNRRANFVFVSEAGEKASLADVDD